jgi:hypothetical protein
MPRAVQAAPSAECATAVRGRALGDGGASYVAWHKYVCMPAAQCMHHGGICCMLCDKWQPDPLGDMLFSPFAM